MSRRRLAGDDLEQAKRYKYLFDIATPVLAIAPRLLKKSYAGYLYRLRETATEDDVLYNPQKYAGLNSRMFGGGTLQTFANGNPVYVPTGYNQTGGTNGTNSTAATQFQLVQNCFLIKPGLRQGRLNFSNSLVNYYSGADKKFTFSFVIKNSLPSTVFLLLAYSFPPITNGVAIAVEKIGAGYSLTLGFGNGVNSFELSTGAIMTAGVTYSLILTYDGSIDTSGVDRCKVYLDRIDKPLTQVASVGGFPFDVSRLGGQIDYVQLIGSSGSFSLGDYLLYNSVLSTEQISRIVTNQSLFYGF